VSAVWKPGAFAGETVSREIAGALLSEVRHVRASSVDPHSHEAPYFSVLLEGSYSESAADFAIRYEPYTLVFHDALTEHSDAIEAGGCRMFFVELLAPWLDVLAEHPRPAHLFELQGGAPVWLVLRIHNELLAGAAASALTVESLLFELCSYLSAASGPSARQPPWLAQAEELIRAALSTGIDLRSLAREVGVDPAHLCRTFRRFRGRTIGDYAVGLRVQSVCRQLVETADSLSEIAERAGFTDQSHMTRIFKRLTGVPPGSYRRSNAITKRRVQ
jgi:AraC family transcriptional regulator